MIGEPVRVQRSRDVRLIEHGGFVTAYPGPHRTPVLPGGWAPLNREQQAAVLCACDDAQEAVVFRLGSLWEPGCEYRVYRLAQEDWAGLSIVTRYLCHEAAVALESGHGNLQLIGLAWDSLQAVKLAIDFFNWDLDAHGQPWRIQVTTTHAGPA